MSGSSPRADYVPALCTHRPSLLPIDRIGESFGPQLGKEFPTALREVPRICSFRGRRSRNKVSVGEPAEGSSKMRVYRTGARCCGVAEASRAASRRVGLQA